MKLTHKMILAFVLIAVLVATSGLIEYLHVRRTHEEFSLVSEGMVPIYQALVSMQFTSSQIVSAANRIVFLSRHPPRPGLQQALLEKSQEMRSSVQALRSHLDVYGRLIGEHFAEERDLHQVIHSSSSEFLAAADRLLGAVEQEDDDQLLAAARSDFDRTAGPLSRAIEATLDAEAAELAERQAHTDTDIFTATLLIILFSSAGLIFLAVLGTTLTVSFSRRLRRFENATILVGQGDLQAQVPVENNDELGSLAQHFNEMTTQLQIRGRELEEARDEILQCHLKEAREQRARLEDRLNQVQKMEAVGQLAGGIAHDFNNLLTAILGNTHRLSTWLGGVEPGGPNGFPGGAVQGIQKAGERAATLTRQLLTFSRKQVRHLEVLDLNHVVRELTDILDRLLGERIELRTVLQPDICSIYADRSQIDQVVMNLVLNARDAMPAGGTVTVETVSGSPPDVTDDEKPQLWAHFRVSDTGSGMPVEVRDRVFEPFFTTKPVGKGTGLGLATVFGIVSQADGHIRVESRIDEGSTFQVWFPGVEAKASRPVIDESTRELPVGKTILVCEDDRMVRDMTCEFLKLSGCVVVAAGDGQLALDMVQKHDGHIDAVVTDVIMPSMNGRELVEALREEQPGLPALFVSGHPRDVIGSPGSLSNNTAFLQKPFSARDLCEQLGIVMEANA